MRTRFAVAALAVALLGAAGCGGDDREDQAREQVCTARDNIGRQVESLRGLTPATATADQVRRSVEAIAGELRTIRDAQADLSEDRRDELQAANQKFAAQVREVASTVARSTSVEQARAQLATAADQLAATYRSTLATVDCS